MKARTEATSAKEEPRIIFADPLQPWWKRLPTALLPTVLGNWYLFIIPLLMRPYLKRRRLRIRVRRFARSMEKTSRPYSCLVRVEFESMAHLVEVLSRPWFVITIGLQGPKDIDEPRYARTGRVLETSTEITVSCIKNGKKFVINQRSFSSRWIVWLPDGNELDEVLN